MDTAACSRHMGAVREWADELVFTSGLIAVDRDGTVPGVAST